MKHSYVTRRHMAKALAIKDASIAMLQEKYEGACNSLRQCEDALRRAQQWDAEIFGSVGASANFRPNRIMAHRPQPTHRILVRTDFDGKEQYLCRAPSLSFWGAGTKVWDWTAFLDKASLFTLHAEPDKPIKKLLDGRCGQWRHLRVEKELLHD